MSSAENRLDEMLHAASVAIVLRVPTKPVAINVAVGFWTFLGTEWGLAV